MQMYKLKLLGKTTVLFKSKLHEILK